MLTSFGFWICLLLTAATYGAATLSTSLVTHDRLAQRFARGDLQLQQLAEQVRRYERYCEQLAERNAADSSPTRASRAMTIDDSLQFRLDAAATPASSTPSDQRIPAVIRALARSSLARQALMVVSAILLIAAFTLLVESPAASLRPSLPRARPHRPFRQRFSRIGTRYRTRADERQCATSR